MENLSSIIKILISICLLFSCTFGQESGQFKIQRCYESPEDLFKIIPLANFSFGLKILSEKCLRIPSLELFLYAFDTTIVDQVGNKEIDQLDQSKLNFFRINRLSRRFGREELSNFRQPDSQFKFAIVFFDHAGVVDIAMQKPVRSFDSNGIKKSWLSNLINWFKEFWAPITIVLLFALLGYQFVKITKMSREAEKKKEEESRAMTIELVEYRPGFPGQRGFFEQEDANEPHLYELVELDNSASGSVGLGSRKNSKSSNSASLPNRPGKVLVTDL